MGKAFTLEKNTKCGLCKAKISPNDLYTIIYEDDNSGKIKHILCDNCDVDDEIAHYRKTGIVHNHLSMSAVMADYHFNEGKSLDRLREDVRHFYTKYKKDLLEIADGNRKIQEAIGAFDVKHWLSYLKNYWNNSKERGHNTKIDGLEVMMWGCAGRVLITITNGKHDITMIFSDEKGNESKGGQQGINAPLATALEMVQKVTKVNKIEFKPDEKVTLAGL